jgi:hypothetical protein
MDVLGLRIRYLASKDLFHHFSSYVLLAIISKTLIALGNMNIVVHICLVIFSTPLPCPFCSLATPSIKTAHQPAMADLPSEFSQ